MSGCLLQTLFAPSAVRARRSLVPLPSASPSGKWGEGFLLLKVAGTFHWDHVDRNASRASTQRVLS